jgi:hypothetical protein
MKHKAPLRDLSHLGYRPQGNETIFHYCTESALWGMLTSQTLWLSSIWAMNDKVELWWGRVLVGLVLARNARKFPPEFRDLVVSSLARPDSHVLPLVASFSRNGDLLSQWRAYADDGKGFAVKFNPKIIVKMPATMKSVVYDNAQQDRLILNSINLFFKYWRLGNEPAEFVLSEVLQFFAFDLIALKHPSFFEEKEVRLVHLIIRSGNSWVDIGGHDEKERPTKGVTVMKRDKYGQEIPYIALQFPNRSVVAGVMLGPKNPLSIEEVKRKLSELGFEDASVRRSISPYR